MDRMRIGRAFAILAGVVILGVVLSGCTGTGTRGRHPQRSGATTAVSPAPTLVSSEQAAATRALEIYKTYLQVAASASSTGEDRSGELRALLGDPLRTQVLLDLLQQQTKGMMYAGELKSNPTISTVRLSDVPPTVVIDDCLDRSNYRLVYRANGSPVPASSRTPRYRALTTAMLYPQVGWLLNKSEISRDLTC